MWFESEFPCLGEKLEAGVLLITHRCSEGHNGIWSSSAVLDEKRGQEICVISILLASSVLITGNNFQKGFSSSQKVRICIM